MIAPSFSRWSLPAPVVAFVSSHSQWWLGVMLLSLHGALALAPDAALSRALFLVHLGAFLLWQPVWRSGQALSSVYSLFVVLIAFLLATVQNAWFDLLWISLLIGLLGGNLPPSAGRTQRLGQLLALAYLLTLLFIWGVPHTLLASMGGLTLFRWELYLPLPLAVLALFLGEGRKDDGIGYTVDFFSSLLLFLLVGMLVFASFVVMVLAHLTYPLAVIYTLLGMAAVLLLLGVLWSPFGGFGGLAMLMSRYSLSIGLPFEQWVRKLANWAEQDIAPEAFLQQAVEGVESVPGVVGARWRTATSEDGWGMYSGYVTSFSSDSVRVQLYTRHAVSWVYSMHLRLLAQLIGHFYEAKRREQVMREAAYTQAIFQTGARLTHDVKNLLQSLTTLCAAAEQSQESDAVALQAMLKRQLPQIAERLQGTLGKLQAPVGEAIDMGSLVLWWGSLQNRYAGERIHFVAPAPEMERDIPVDLYSSVAENLLQNALLKQRVQPDIEIHVSLGATGLQVCDSGAPVRDEVLSRLFAAPVASEWGLGIGLYQSARLAQLCGYRLGLVHNRPGEVCFELCLTDSGKR